MNAAVVVVEGTVRLDATLEVTQTGELPASRVRLTAQPFAEQVRARRFRTFTEHDIVFELLLKLGLELTVPIEQTMIAGKTVHSVGVGTLLVCLAPEITQKEIEPRAHGTADWRKELAPVGEAQVVFRDSSFGDDVAKTNITAILAQRGLEKVRSL